MDWQAVTDTIMETCRNTFGTPVLYQPRNGEPLPMTGIFEEASQISDIGVSSELEGFTAIVDFVTRDLAFRPSRADLIVVPKSGKSYKIIKPEFDGWSRHRLYLKEIA